jgi:hypothetical protein
MAQILPARAAADAPSGDPLLKLTRSGGFVEMLWGVRDWQAADGMLAF